MRTEQLLTRETTRMETTRLLSDCYQLPDKDLPEKVKRLASAMADACNGAMPSVRAMCRAIEDTAPEPLKIDFSKLFVGPYTLLAAPYGSVYLDGERKIMGASTLDVIRRYRQAGLETASDFNDAPDHIFAELEFLYYLVFKELEAFSRADPGKAAGFLRHQKSFLGDHLLAWVPEFAARIQTSAEHPFYPNLAQATELFLKKSLKTVGLLYDSVSHASTIPLCTGGASLPGHQPDL